MQQQFVVDSPATRSAERTEVGSGMGFVRDGAADLLTFEASTLVRVESAEASPEFGSSVWGIASMVAAPACTHEQLCLALYQALRRGRIHRKATVSVAPGVLPDALLELIQATAGRSARHMVARTDIALARLAQVFEPVIHAPAAFYLREVAETVRLHVERAFEEGFFRSVIDGQLTKQQYVYILAQQHAYVRYTTRILGYCVAYSGDSELRKHFAKHLAEEVNHEKILEADLTYLADDVSYLIDDFEPNPATLQFVLGELALISHFHDPIMLTAAPLVAEGISGHLGRGFTDRLRSIVRSWGYAEPERATRFFCSHIEYDGGEDGHFEGSMKLLSDHLTNERALRRYLSAVHALGQCFSRIYTESMREADAWG